ncbi:MAG: SDR family NAD(P)-dependent oxidoreductase [Patescibacteria group bacterium]|nr:SDR family NAD(P)-dependent oxidoreductase [Patescibacteria group bacterium]
MNAKKKIAIVTGGAGFIGSHLAKTLLERGYEVRVIDSLIAGKHAGVPAQADFFETDIRDAGALPAIFSGAETVFHLAALPRVEYSIQFPKETHETNVTGTVNVLAAAREAGVARIIFASSSAIYGDQDRVPFREDAAPDPLSPYALHKYIGEKYLVLFSKLYGLRTASLRFFNVYGPGIDPEGPYALVIGKFLKLTREGMPLTITGDGKQTRDFVHVRDVVRALIAAAEKDAIGKGEVINIGTGRGTSINELADFFGGEREYLPSRIEPRSSCADISKAKNILGWEPDVRLADGIAELKNDFPESKGQ